MGQPLPERTRQLFDYICSYRLEHGYSPSLVEMSVELGYRNAQARPASVQLKNLIAAGLVKTTAGVARSAVPIRYPE
jgi:SOS-response transcriptional repressor LexA